MGRLFDLLLMVAVLMAATNPDPELHRKAVCDSLAVGQTSGWSFGKVAADLRGKAIAAPLKYNNYYLFSTTTSNGTAASFGAFSHVWMMK